jgi:hypothetical protein
VITLSLSRDVELAVRNPTGCCEQTSAPIHPGGKDQHVEMNLRPGRVSLVCTDQKTGGARAGVQAILDGQPVELGKWNSVPFGNTVDMSRHVKVEFIGDGIDNTPKQATVKAGQPTTVECVAK